MQGSLKRFLNNMGAHKILSSKKPYPLISLYYTLHQDTGMRIHLLLSLALPSYVLGCSNCPAAVRDLSDSRLKVCFED